MHTRGSCTDILLPRNKCQVILNRILFCNIKIKFIFLGGSFFIIKFFIGIYSLYVRGFIVNSSGGVPLSTVKY
jgi:hypothetical protein